MIWEQAKKLGVQPELAAWQELPSIIGLILRVERDELYRVDKDS